MNLISREPKITKPPAGAPSAGTGWTAMARTIRDVDEAKIRDCKEDIDTVLVFAGLFSAVMTAFLLATCTTLKEDPQDTTNALLAQIVEKLDGMPSNGSSADLLAPSSSNSIHASSSHAPFEASSSDVRVNALWFASLICSLVTASIGMLVKQWLREYLAGDFVSPQARLRVRLFRYASLKRWKVLEIAAVLPLLLQISLGLFFLGLCVWTMSLHRTIGWMSVPLVCAWAIVLLLTTVAPAFSSRCPYKTSLPFQGVSKWLRAQSFRVASLRARLSWSTVTLSILPTTNPKVPLDSAPPPRIARPLEEEDVVSDESADMDVLLDADALLSDDTLLGTTIWESLRQMECDGSDIVRFVYRIIEHRLQTSMEAVRFPLDLRRLTKRGWLAISNILADALASEMHREDFRERLSPLVHAPWMKTALTIVCSTSSYALPRCSTDIIVQCMLVDPGTVGDILVAGRKLSRDDLATFLATFRDAFKVVSSFDLIDCVKQVLRACGADISDPNAFTLREALSAAKLPLATVHAIAGMLIDLVTREATRELGKDNEDDLWLQSHGKADEALSALLWASSQARDAPRDDSLSESDVSSVSGGFGDKFARLFGILIAHPTSCSHILAALARLDEDSLGFASDAMARTLDDTDSPQASRFLEDFTAIIEGMGNGSSTAAYAAPSCVRTSLVKFCLFALFVLCTHAPRTEHVEAWRSLFGTLAVSLQAVMDDDRTHSEEEEGTAVAMLCLQMLHAEVIQMRLASQQGASAESYSVTTSLNSLVGDALVKALTRACGAYHPSPCAKRGHAEALHYPLDKISFPQPQTSMSGEA